MENSQQPYSPNPPQETSPLTRHPKKQGLSIASFILSGLAYLPPLIIFFSLFVDYDDGDTAMGLVLLLFILLLVYMPIPILISSILAIIGLANHKTKSALIALLVALIPTASIYIFIYATTGLLPFSLL